MKSKPLSLLPIKKRMENAQVNPWKKRKGTFGWYVVDPLAAGGTNDVLIASGLDGSTAEFLRHVPDDVRALIQEVERLRGK